MNVYLNAVSARFAEKLGLQTSNMLGQPLSFPYFNAFKEPLLSLKQLYHYIDLEINRTLQRAGWDKSDLKNIPILLGSTAYMISDCETRVAHHQALPKEYNLTVDYVNNGERKYIVFNVYKGSNLRISFSTIDKRFVKAYMLDGDDIYIPIDYGIFSQSMMYSVFATEFMKAHGIYDTDKEFKSFYKDALYYHSDVDDGNVFAGITSFFLPSDDEGVVYDVKGLFEDIKWLSDNKGKLEKITGGDGYSSSLKSIDAESFTLKCPYSQGLPDVVIFYKEVEKLALVYMEKHVDSSFVFAIKYDANRDKYLVNYNEIYNVLMYENNIQPTNITDSYLKNIFFVKIMNDVKMVSNMIRVHEFVHGGMPEDIMKDIFAKSELSTEAVDKAMNISQLFTNMGIELIKLMQSTQNLNDNPDLVVIQVYITNAFTLL